VVKVDKYPECHFLLVGDGERRQELETLVPNRSSMGACILAAAAEPGTDLCGFRPVLLTQPMKVSQFSYEYASREIGPWLRDGWGCQIAGRTGFTGCLVPPGDQPLATAIAALLRTRNGLTNGEGGREESTGI